MAQIDWSGLQAAAAAEGFTNEILPDGTYDVKVASTKVGKSSGGKDQIGVRLVITTGPHANKGVWDNLTLTTDSPKAMAVFFRKCFAYGADADAFNRGDDLQALAAAFQDRTGVAEVGHRSHNDKTYQDIKSFKATEGQAPAAPGLAALGAAAFAQAPQAPVAFTLPPAAPVAPVAGAPSF